MQRNCLYMQTCKQIQDPQENYQVSDIQKEEMKLDAGCRSLQGTTTAHLRCGIYEHGFLPDHRLLRNPSCIPYHFYCMQSCQSKIPTLVPKRMYMASSVLCLPLLADEVSPNPHPHLTTLRGVGTRALLALMASTWPQQL